MLKDYPEQLLELSDEEFRLAKKYALERKKYGEKYSEFGIILAANMLSIKERSKSAGVEMSERILIAEKPELGNLWADIQKHYNNYKAIERMIDAVKNKIWSVKGIMNYNLKGEIREDYS